MAPSDSEEEGGDDLEFDRLTEADGDEDDEDILDIEVDVEGTEADEDSPSDDSDEDDEDDEDDEEHATAPTVDGSSVPSADGGRSSESQSQEKKVPSVPLQTRTRSISPAQARRNALVIPSGSGGRVPRAYTVEAICALPHPVPTHALASSLCMTHLLTGSDDGYIRDYDIFTAVNGKNFLSAPQRHHCGVVEGIMKAGQIRYWWENPDMPRPNGNATAMDESPLSPVYCLAMHSDALWTLAGSNVGHINLFTTRHEPGRLCHVMHGHRGPVSALAMEHGEKGFFSAGWDGEALQWDLNTGQTVRKFTAHGAQLAAIAVRPIASEYTGSVSPTMHRMKESPVSPTVDPSLAEHTTTQGDTMTSSAPHPSGAANLETQPAANVQTATDLDAKSDASFDPLFDDEPDGDGDIEMNAAGQVLQATGEAVPPQGTKLTIPDSTQGLRNPAPNPGRMTVGSVAPPKNAPPLLDSASYATFSPDILMTAAIDGQVMLWDKRVQSQGKGVGRLWMSEKTPPWCLSACWSADGAQLYAGRRIGTVDVWDVRQLGVSGPSSTPRLLKTLRNPLSSGVVSCVVAFPDGRHIACASIDNLRLWNVAEAGEPDAFGKSKSGVQFKIIPGHHGGYISQMLVDPAARFLVSASSNRGWHGDSTRTVFVHDIKHIY